MKGVSATLENPGKNRAVKWIAEHINYAGDDCLIWPFGYRNSGYGLTWYQGKRIDAHRLICILAHGEPPTPQHHATHSCGRGQAGCVNQRHLKWGTRSENMRDKWNGEVPRKRYVLSPAQVLEIRACKGKGKSNEIAERYKVSEATIRDIQSGKSWKKLPWAEAPQCGI